MLDMKEVIKGLQIERECVSRDCDRDCGKCDLVQERDWLLAVYDDAIELLKEQEAKQPIHVHEEFEEHDWFRDEKGEIDEFAFDANYHNGPMCKRCYYSFCTLCDPNGWNKEPCVIDGYKCPRCEKHIGKGTKFCSNCGQEVKWE